MTGDDTGWNLPKFASYSHAPALNEKVLVLPHNFRGVIMGCTLRCEGGYEDRPQIVHFAQDRVKLAAAQADLAGKLQTGGQDRREEDQQHDAARLQERAHEYKSEAERLKKYKTTLKKMEGELVPKKQELGAVKSTLKEALEFESDARKVSPESTAVRGQGKIKMTNVEQQQLDEEGEISAGAEARKGGAGVTGGAGPEQLSSCHLLSELTDTATQLQLEVLQLEKSIREATAVHATHRKEEDSLVAKLKILQTDQQILAYKQQVLARAQGNSELLRVALQNSGPTLVSALVIGFDMESEGLSSALARIFRRVGFINFSSDYADYKNPVKVTSRSRYIFNATLPADILTRVGLEDNEQLTVFDEMMEIWYKNFKQTSLSGDRKVSNYVVIGPVSDSMHVATGWLQFCG
jgi:myosin heavy subunit